MTRDSIAHISKWLGKGFIIKLILEKIHNLTEIRIKKCECFNYRRTPFQIFSYHTVKLIGIQIFDFDNFTKSVDQILFILYPWLCLKETEP